MKAEKCEFYVTTTSFLGYIISPGEIKTDPVKLTAVQEWPQPTNCKQLQRFLDFTILYHRFMRNFHKVAAPLNALTSTAQPFCWSSAAEEAFQDLKKCFASAPILYQPDPDLQFIMEVDASDTRAGAVLSQHSPLDHKFHPCAIFSRRLSPAERNYNVEIMSC